MRQCPSPATQTRGRQVQETGGPNSHSCSATELLMSVNQAHKQPGEEQLSDEI